MAKPVFKSVPTNAQGDDWQAATGSSSPVDCSEMLDITAILFGTSGATRHARRYAAAPGSEDTSTPLGDTPSCTTKRPEPISGFVFRSSILAETTEMAAVS